MILFLRSGLTYSGEYGETEHQTGAEGPDPVALKNMITITITITITMENGESPAPCPCIPASPSPPPPPGSPRWPDVAQSINNNAKCLLDAVETPLSLLHCHTLCLIWLNHVVKLERLECSTAIRIQPTNEFCWVNLSVSLWQGQNMRRYRV